VQYPLYAGPAVLHLSCFLLIPNICGFHFLFSILALLVIIRNTCNILWQCVHFRLPYVESIVSSSLKPWAERGSSNLFSFQPRERLLGTNAMHMTKGPRCKAYSRPNKPARKTSGEEAKGSIDPPCPIFTLTSLLVWRSVLDTLSYIPLSSQSQFSTAALRHAI